MALGLAAVTAAAFAMPAIAAESGTPRDGTRVEMVERFCGKNMRCKTITKAEIAKGRTVQGVIVALGESLLERTWSNSDRAYDAMTRALTFAYDFMAASELEAGQTEFAGGRVETLREILGDAAWICDVRGAFPSKYHCLKRRLVAFEPGWPQVSAADVGGP